MSRAARTGRLDRARPWIALALPPLAWVTGEYGLDWVLHGPCGKVESGLGLAFGAGGVLVCLAAVAIAWPVARSGGGENPAVRPWLARVAAVGAGIFALAITLQALATAIVPACAR